MSHSMFAIENIIKDHLISDNILHGSKILLSEEVDKILNSNIFKGLSDADSLALMVNYASYKLPDETGRCTSHAQTLEVSVKIMVVCPRELAQVSGGELFINVMSSVKNMTLPHPYSKLRLINDVREFNEPLFDNNIAYIPMMFGVNMIII